ncbi:hypothetical protein BD324DRAFT_649020 [Kockovaella imperatae]|uniref:Uncharacterized protein n=1 Tax=Kockovaella imperatae TaxID=4999 RepID=A0A1Y1ULJ9_9TREE|nr:hypothetical protein BD324DRAFT_649020 [Kockovaella imperatae]ORX38921.1 hypothetical protein BD324DRAFT_649020 [Kockovaella imperatae]
MAPKSRQAAEAPQSKRTQPARPGTSKSSKTAPSKAAGSKAKGDAIQYFSNEELGPYGLLWEQDIATALARKQPGDPIHDDQKVIDWLQKTGKCRIQPPNHAFDRMFPTYAAKFGFRRVHSVPPSEGEDELDDDDQLDLEQASPSLEAPQAALSSPSTVRTKRPSSAPHSDPQPVKAPRTSNESAPNRQMRGDERLSMLGTTSTARVDVDFPMFDNLVSTKASESPQDPPTPSPLPASAHNLQKSPPLDSSSRSASNDVRPAKTGDRARAFLEQMKKRSSSPQSFQPSNPQSVVIPPSNQSAPAPTPFASKSGLHVINPAKAMFKPGLTEPSRLAEHKDAQTAAIPPEPTSIPLIKDHVTKWTELNKERKESVVTLKAQLQAFSAKVEQHSSGLIAAGDQQLALFEDVLGAIEPLAKENSNLVARSKELEGQISGFESRLVAYADKDAERQKELEMVEKSLVEVKQQLEQCQGQRDAAENCHINAVRERQAAVEQRDKAFESVRQADLKTSAAERISSEAAAAVEDALARATESERLQAEVDNELKVIRALSDAQSAEITSLKRQAQQLQGGLPPPPLPPTIIQAGSPSALKPLPPILKPITQEENKKPGRAKSIPL